MKLAKKAKSDLDKKFQKVVEAPMNFALFTAIHDFIEHIETTPALLKNISYSNKINREANVPAKYGYLRQIYQGVEDTNTKTNDDLGHARYMVVRDLGYIKKAELSESNFFWKKRELFKKLTGEVYEVLKMEPVAVGQ
jgi:hypothetical protein